jgi:hypothetical protein
MNKEKYAKERTVGVGSGRRLIIVDGVRGRVVRVDRHAIAGRGDVGARAVVLGAVKGGGGLSLVVHPGPEVVDTIQIGRERKSLLQ